MSKRTPLEIKKEAFDSALEEVFCQLALIRNSLMSLQRFNNGLVKEIQRQQEKIDSYKKGPRKK